MGICSSCLKPRDKRSHSNEPNETQPLLGDNNTGDNDILSEENDQHYVQRQQELANLVHVTHDYFIDVPGFADSQLAEQSADQPVDIDALTQQINEREGTITLDLSQVNGLTSAERERLEKELSI